jgi:diaminopimelate epimerase
VRFLTLIKYQALGNDYLVLDLPADLDAVISLLPQLCDRHLGVGSDGLLVFDPATFAVRIFNPDGSEPERSGNGLRIAACHALLEHGAPESFSLGTRDRLNQVRIRKSDAYGVLCELDLGPAHFPFGGGIELETGAGCIRCFPVEIGNPHCVVLGEPVTPQRCRQLGPHLEHHPRFPNRTNVQLAEAIDRKTARCEIWERGAGYTLASGTSATAVAAALMQLNLVDTTVQILMPGGSLSIRREREGNLIQTGPAHRVFRAAVDLAAFDQSSTV